MHGTKNPGISCRSLQQEVSPYPSKAQETITYTCSTYNILKLPYYTSSPSFADKYEEGDNSGFVLLFDMGGGLYTIYLML